MDSCVQTTNAHCSYPEETQRNYHVQGFRLNSDRTRVAMVYQPA